MAVSPDDILCCQSQPTAQSLRRGTAALAVLTATAGLLAASLGCGIAALWLAVTPVLGPAGAALVSAAVLLLMAGLGLAVARRLMRRLNPAKPVPSSAGLTPTYLGEKATWISAALAPDRVAGGRRA